MQKVRHPYASARLGLQYKSFECALLVRLTKMESAAQSNSRSTRDYCGGVVVAPMDTRIHHRRHQNNHVSWRSAPDFVSAVGVADSCPILTPWTATMA